jgi:hypothetical protein
VRPLRDPGVTHTICVECLERLQREERRTRGRAIVIVRRSRRALQERLEAALAGVPDVTVRTDQRVGERRGPSSERTGPDRRRFERRRSPEGLHRVVWEAFDVWLSR